MPRSRMQSIILTPSNSTIARIFRGWFGMDEFQVFEKSGPEQSAAQNSEKGLTVVS
jgi:hypothetical protein